TVPAGGKNGNYESKNYSPDAHWRHDRHAPRATNTVSTGRAGKSGCSVFAAEQCRYHARRFAAANLAATVDDESSERYEFHRLNHEPSSFEETSKANGAINLFCRRFDVDQSRISNLSRTINFLPQARMPPPLNLLQFYGDTMFRRFVKRANDMHIAQTFNS